MSDIVTVAIIAGLQAVAVAWLNRKTGEKVNKVHEAIAETKAAMVTLEKNTNSIKDALVESTAKQQHAAGKLEGRAEFKAELQEGSEEESG